MDRIKTGFTTLALIGLVSAVPVQAAGATRSAASLPLLAASAGSVTYTPGLENVWRCVETTDEALKLKQQYVQLDAQGRVVLDAKGNPYRCRAPVTAYKAGRQGFPFEILLGILGAGGLILALAGSGSNDSPG